MTTELVLLSRVAYRGREITGPRLRGLLALLAGDLRAGCSTARLVDGLWPDERPENPAKALQVLVSRARAQLGADVIVSTPTGYRLTLAEDQVDSSAVLLTRPRARGSARAGDHAGALAHAEAGLALWDAAARLADPADADDPVSRAARGARADVPVAARGPARWRWPGWAGRAEAVEPLAEAGSGAAARRGGAAGAAALRGGDGRARRRRWPGTRRTGARCATSSAPIPAPRCRPCTGSCCRTRRPWCGTGCAHEPNPLLGRDDGHRRGGRAAAHVPGHLDRRARRPGQDAARARRQPPGRAAGRALRRRSPASRADDDVAGEVASALGVGERRRRVGRAGPRTDVVAGIAAALGPGPALLVLDNCEHVVRGAADLVRALVSMTRDLRVLTTSRAPLGLSSESVYPLPELDLPTIGRAVRAAGAGGPARRRAARRRRSPSCAATSTGCRSPWSWPRPGSGSCRSPRSPARLDDRFALLRGGARDAPQRHRTLHAVVDWSWNLLDAGRAGGDAGAVGLPGGFTADAARQLLGDDGARCW